MSSPVLHALLADLDRAVLEKVKQRRLAHLRSGRHRRTRLAVTAMIHTRSKQAGACCSMFQFLHGGAATVKIFHFPIEMKGNRATLRTANGDDKKSIVISFIARRPVADFEPMKPSSHISPSRSTANQRAPRIAGRCEEGAGALTVYPMGPRGSRK
jgi:hypothetical protein